MKMNWNEFFQWVAIGVLFAAVQIVHMTTPIGKPRGRDI